MNAEAITPPPISIPPRMAMFLGPYFCCSLPAKIIVIAKESKPMPNT